MPDLDLTLFRLPTDIVGPSAEGALARRPLRRDQLKAKFWGALARRYDLTGKGSIVTTRPRVGSAPRSLTRVDGWVERLEARSEAQASFLPGSRKPRESHLVGRVTSLLSEVTPQFFLRNVPRMERDVNIRGGDYQIAVWRDDEGIAELLASMRPPRIERWDPDTQLASELADVCQQERWERLMGFHWEEKLTGHYPRPRRTHAPSFHGGVRKISVWDISLKPAPANRYLMRDNSKKVLTQLNKRFDATIDDPFIEE